MLHQHSIIRRKTIELVKKKIKKQKKRRNERKKNKNRSQKKKNGWFGITQFWFIADP